MGLREVPEELTDFIAVLRATEGLRTKGKSQSTFYIGSKPFLHFHDGSGGLEADVRFSGSHFVRVPVNTPAEQAELLQRVEGHLS